MGETPAWRATSWMVMTLPPLRLLFLAKLTLPRCQS
jgi:hypothetical protein